ncbi:ABC transporter permease [Nonlabens marinus]|uniref:Transport permease protein n=1 Tax=Nonlabens marinus S1-08 TaxID=1454201 RepID=W8VVF5_9FLAO|nr:ABC transporter permease [Nonlabens marinus]BAO55398.1 O-antigen export system, permease protein [Nonlabens marinus S1-08]
MKGSGKWDIEVDSRQRVFQHKIPEILKYKDLLILLVRRDIVINYKQTILGPLWLIIKPLITSAIYVVVFNRLAKLSTDNIPPILFQMAGVVLWSFIAETIKINSDCFKLNADIFSKVYFPRAVVPLANTLNTFFQFGIQFVLFLGFILFYYVKGYQFGWDLTLLLFPVLILICAMFSLGIGMIVSSFTYKYRDLQLLLTFAVQLAMYATPVIYPLSTAPPSLRWVLLMNPMTAVLEAFRNIFLNSGFLSYQNLLISAIVSFLLFITGLFIFNRTEKNFMDTV